MSENSQIDLLTALSASTAGVDLRPTAGFDGKLRVMIVDDNVDAADLMGMFFETIGHQAKPIYGGHAALQCVAEFKPHLLFIDIEMPLLGGRDLVKLMRKDPELDSSIFIAFSGHHDEQSKYAAFEAGFHKYIAKPCEMTTLSTLVEEYVAARQH